VKLTTSTLCKCSTVYGEDRTSWYRR